MDSEIKRIISESYNTNAKLREKFELVQWKLDELEWFTSFFASTAGLKLLDVGAGAGQQGDWLQSRGFNVHCIDNSVEMVNFCLGRGLKAEVMDFYDIDYKEGTFDAVWSMNALLHVPKRSLPQVLSSIRKVLRPGGLFYMGVYGGHNSEGIWPNDSYVPNRYFTSYTHEDIQAVVSQHYEVMHFKVTEMAGDSPDYQSMVLRKA